MRKLSERQRNILKYIQEYLEARGYPPSIREIGDRVGISSTSVVDYNLRVLEREGLIRRDREVSRGLEIVGGARGGRQAGPKLLRIPIVGNIAAGVPIEAIEDPSETLEFPLGSLPDGCFALRVKGTSMIEDHIDDGDIVVATIPSDSLANSVATLKRFYREGDRVRLQPRNPAMQPLIVPAAQVEIKGKVVKLVRDL